MTGRTNCHFDPAWRERNLKSSVIVRDESLEAISKDIIDCFAPGLARNDN